MPEKRFFLETPFEKGAFVQLIEEEFHHLRVMRAEKGEIVELINGKNQLALAHLKELTKKSANFTLIDVTTSSPPSRRLILAQSCLRPKNLELVIEKGTELGTTEFWIFPGERGGKDHLSSNQLHRLHLIIISAMKQCGRLDLPTLQLSPPLLEWKESPSPTAFFGDLHSQTPLSSTLSDVTIFIGPEKGLSESEHAYLDNILKVKGIRLNPHILRAETAAICALSIINN